jgi:hypothetical protein
MNALDARLSCDLNAPTEEGFLDVAASAQLTFRDAYAPGIL